MVRPGSSLDCARNFALVYEGLVAVSQVLAEGQPNDARPPIDHRTGIAAGHLRFGHDPLYKGPACAVVETEPQNQADFAGIAPPVLAPFGKGQQRVRNGDRQGRDTIGAR